MADIAVDTPHSASYASSSASEVADGSSHPMSAGQLPQEDGAKDGMAQPKLKRKKGEKSTTIQTACVYCRGSKMKCIRSNEQESCKRCIAAKITCETKARRSGRKPGSGSKVAKEAGQAEAGAQPTSTLSGTSRGGSQSAHSGQPLPNAPNHPDIFAIPGLSVSQSYSQNIEPSFAMPYETSSVHRSPSSHSPGSVGNPASFHFSQDFGAPTGYSSSSYTNQNGQLQMQQHIPLASTSSSLQNPPASSTGLSQFPLLDNVAQNGDHPALSQAGYAPLATHASISSKSFDNPSVARPANGRMNSIILPDDESMSLNLSRSGKGQQQNFTRSPLALLAAAGAANRKEQNAPETQSVQSLRAFLGLQAPFDGHSEPDNAPVSSGPRNFTASKVTHTNYFREASFVQSKDYDQNNDPIHLCIVTEEEARHLVGVYWDHLQPLVALLDIRLHDFAQVRSRATFLFTSMMSSAAKFVEGYSAAAQRLDEHAKTLSAKAILSGSASLDTVQAFCILCPWLDTGTHVSLDTTSTYLSLANDRFKRLQSELPTATFEDRLRARSYQRTYLTLFCYDRGSALIMGEPLGFSVPERRELVGSVFAWSTSPDATRDDWTVGALASLRRDVPGILKAVTKQRNYDALVGATQPSPQIIRLTLSEFLSSWQTTWMLNSVSSPYLLIVGHHTMLSILITTLKEHVGKPTETAVLQQALLAALQTLQAFVSPDQHLLTYLVNNTFVMVAYAAAFVLKVLVQWRDVGSSVEASIYVLLSQVETRLNDIGSFPSHRYGRSRIYGQQLGHILRNQLQSRLPTRQPTPEVTEGTARQGDTYETTLRSSNFTQDVGQGIFEGEPSSGLSPFLNGDLGAGSLDVAHMSAEEMTDLLSKDYWLPLESNDFFDTSSFFGAGDGNNGISMSTIGM